MVIRCFVLLSAIILSFLAPRTAPAEPVLEAHLTPGKAVPKVRAIACNTPEQLKAVLTAYSASYDAGRRMFEAQRRRKEYDAAAERMAPACDEVWFTAIIPVRTVFQRAFDVVFADGSRHRRYIVEAKAVKPDGNAAAASYFISSRWRVLSLETAL